MAKTTTKKTTGKKPVKTVTMADLKRQQDRIETVLCQMSEFLREATDKAVIRIDHRTREDGKALKELYHTTNKIEREVSLIRSGASFMQELDKNARQLQNMKEVGEKWDAEEQGLQPGDYTDASKEVADALTAMVPNWWEDSDRFKHSFIEFTDCEGMLNSPWPSSRTHYPQAEFLSRAAVEAKKLGMVAVEPKPWKPEVGDWVVVLPQDQRVKGSTGSNGRFPIHPVQILAVEIGQATLQSGSWSGGPYCNLLNLRPATPEEVAKYRADQEAAKPIVPYVTRVMFAGKEWRVIRNANKNGRYQIHRVDEYKTAWSDFVKRSEFTVIDP